MIGIGFFFTNLLIPYTYRYEVYETEITKQILYFQKYHKVFRFEEIMGRTYIIFIVSNFFQFTISKSSFLNDVIDFYIRFFVGHLVVYLLFSSV